jgi:Putative transposase, YhgA-like
MTPRTLTDEEYKVLKQKLHQAHDKLIKLTLQEVSAMRELIEKVIMPLLEGIKIDLDSLALDTTTYIRQNLQAFYSDIVYQAMLIDGNSALPIPALVALLIEHKSEMPKQLAMRLQSLDYISAIMKKHYNKDTDKTIPVLAIIFNQFNKDWKPQTFRSQFPQLSKVVSRLIPEFDLLVINLPSMPDEILESLDKYGTLKASLLAMKNVRNKRFLKKHIEDIFVFLQEHPKKTDLRDQLITYLLGQSDLSGKDLDELISNIFSPVLKEEIMISGTGFLAVAAREAAAKTRAEMQQQAERAAKKAKAAIAAAKEEAVQARQDAEKTRQDAEKTRQYAEKTRKDAEKTRQESLLRNRISVMRGWNRDASLDLIIDMTDLPQNEVEELIVAFEKVKTHTYSQTDVDTNELVALSGLTEFEVKALLILLQKK